ESGRRSSHAQPGSMFRLRAGATDACRCFGLAAPTRPRATFFFLTAIFPSCLIAGAADAIETPYPVTRGKRQRSAKDRQGYEPWFPGCRRRPPEAGHALGRREVSE